LHFFKYFVLPPNVSIKTISKHLKIFLNSSIDLFFSFGEAKPERSTKIENIFLIKKVAFKTRLEPFGSMIIKNPPGFSQK